MRSTWRLTWQLGEHTARVGMDEDCAWYLTGGFRAHAAVRSDYGAPLLGLPQLLPDDVYRLQQFVKFAETEGRTASAAIAG